MKVPFEFHAWQCVMAVTFSGASAFAAAVSAPALLPTAPSGFTNASAPTPTMAGDLGETLLDGFTFATSLSGTYDSNVRQSPGIDGFPIEDDFIISLGGTVSYLSKSPELVFGGTYHGNYSDYLSHSEFSGFDQGAGVSASYAGGRFSANLLGNVDFTRGSNRNYGSAFIEQTNYSTSLALRYRLSSKTSLAGNIGENLTVASGDFADTQSFDLGGSALWQYSPLTEVGPGLRYTYRAADNQNARSSVGPTVTLNYKLSSKVSLNSRVGVDFASYEDGGSADPTLSTSIGMNYRASKLWGMTLSLVRDTQADPTRAGTYYENTALRLGYNRKVRRATFNAGLTLESNTYTNDQGDSQPDSDRNYLSFDTSLGMPILSNTTFASVYMRYNDQNGSEFYTWEGIQLGISVNRSF